MHCPCKEKAASHLVNESIQVCIIQINGWVVFQQCNQKPLYLSTLYVPSVVQVIYSESNCMFKHIRYAWLIMIDCC